MTTYYVGSGGSDSNAGTSWANRWATVGKVIGATGAASGDTVYIAPGVYREVLTANGTWTSEVQIIGDTTGVNTSGTPGIVRITAFTTSDTASPSATALLNPNSKSYLTWKSIYFEGGTSTTNLGNGAVVPINWKFEDCYFTHTATSTNLFTWTATVNTSHSVTFKRCLFNRAAHTITAPTSTTANYNINILFENCIWLNAGSHLFSASGSNSFKGGGVTYRNCSIHGVGNAINVNNSNWATAFPVVVENCVFLGAGSTALLANTSGQITDGGYNVLMGYSVARTNVTAGTGSTTTRNPHVSYGQERLVPGWAIRHLGTPLPDSALLGFGQNGNAPTGDFINRNRPAGGSSTSYAAGPFERHDTAQLDTSTYDTASPSLKIVGPGTQRINIPVDNVSTTITIRAYADASHGSSTPPQAVILANPKLGVTEQTITMSANTGQWNTLTFSSFTPSAKGQITMELRSRSSASTGIAFFDNLTRT